MGIAVIAVLAVSAIFLLFNSPDIRNYPPKDGPIVFLGDSLVQGVGATAGKDLPSLVSRVVGLPIENFGVSGNTTADGLARVDTVLERDPSIVLVLLGGNDYLRKVPIDDTFANLRNVITKLQNSGAVVLVVGIRGGLLVDAFEPRFEDLVEETGSAYVPDALRGLLADSRYMSDAIHPNDAGYARLAARVASTLRDLVR
jgi:lysophospholipase L1-like esterase